MAVCVTGILLYSSESEWLQVGGTTIAGQYRFDLATTSHFEHSRPLQVPPLTHHFRCSTLGPSLLAMEWPAFLSTRKGFLPPTIVLNPPSPLWRTKRLRLNGGCMFPFQGLGRLGKHLRRIWC